MRGFDELERSLTRWGGQEEVFGDLRLLYFSNTANSISTEASSSISNKVVRTRRGVWGSRNNRESQLVEAAQEK